MGELGHSTIKLNSIQFKLLNSTGTTLFNSIYFLKILHIYDMGELGHSTKSRYTILGRYHW